MRRKTNSPDFCSVKSYFGKLYVPQTHLNITIVLDDKRFELLLKYVIAEIDREWVIYYCDKSYKTAVKIKLLMVVDDESNLFRGKGMKKKEMKGN